MTTGYVPGAFDMFHIGHLNILRRARAQCETLIAGVVCDQAVIQMKGRPPVIPLEERMEILRELRCVDQVVCDESSDKRLIWEQYPFDVIFKGDDWRGTAKGRRLEADMLQVGASVVYFPYTVQTSSTALRRYLDGA